MAENFAAFDYKTQEEVFTVIKYLTNILSTTGMQLLEIISPSHMLSHLHGAPQSPVTKGVPSATNTVMLEQVIEWASHLMQPSRTT